VPDVAAVPLQVDRMVSDAEKFSEEDKKQREAVDIRNSVRTAHLHS
jgi:molecular chaperone DnaK (HSP70)